MPLKMTLHDISDIQVYRPRVKLKCVCDPVVPDQKRQLSQWK